jgi:hypothetical protein
VEGARASTETKIDYSAALKITSRMPERVFDYVGAVKADAAIHGHDPPTGEALTIAVARLIIADHPHLKPERRTA